MRPQEILDAIERHGLWLEHSGGQRANLSLQKLQNLQNASLQSKNLSRAKLTGTDFTRAKLQDSDLSESDLFGANFHFANLEGADLRGAKLRSTNLRRANLAGADLREGMLMKADGPNGGQIVVSDLTACALDGANLCGPICARRKWTAARRPTPT